MGLLGLIFGRATIAVVFIAFAAYIYTVRYLNSRRINRLGARAPRHMGKWPLAIDISYEAVKSAKENRVMEFWDDLFDNLGCRKNNNFTFEWRMLADFRLIFTTEVENIKAILTTQFDDYGKGPRFHTQWEQFLGDSIFTTDGKQWHDSRQLIRPMFMRERVADLDIIEEHVRKLIRLMGSGEGAMVRFDQLISRFTLDAVTHFLFGKSAGGLDDGEADFMAAFDEVQRIQSIMVRAGPISHLIPKKSFKDGLEVMARFIEPIITQVLEMSPSELESKVGKSDTFLHQLARFTRDRKVIRDQLVALLLAGRDTTASTLSWAVLELSRNPQVVQKLRAEIAEVVGKTGLPPTYEDIKNMKYLNYIINETLRLYPPVPYNIRASIKDTTLPRGGGPDGSEPVGVPKGTPIGYSTLMMQRNRVNYPPISESFPYDPLEWVPDRWATWTPKAWTFIPFNGGPRICIGQQFAMVEMGYVLTRIFQEFDTLVDYANKIVFKSDIVLVPAEGVKVGFVKSELRSEKA